MKLPFEFGSKLILRLLLPGTVIGAASLPLALALRDAASLRLDDLTVFAIVSLVFGWIILLSDMPIYMLFEGRRYWPERLRRRGLKREAGRLRRLRTLAENSSLSEAVRREYQIQRADGYPLGSDSIEEARYPTRLGNLLTAFEEYPQRKYGLDGVFFWHRLWVAIDKDLREELDNAQAIVDGALYLTMSLIVVAMMSFAYGATAFFWPNALPVLVFSPPALVLCGIVAIAASRTLYLLSLYGQRQYGELFKALFDQHRDKLAIQGIVDELAAHFGDEALPSRPERTRNMAAWRFLRWNRYRHAGVNQPVTNWE